MVPPVFKTGLAGIAFAGRFDSFPPPPFYLRQLWDRRIFQQTIEHLPGNAHARGLGNGGRRLAARLSDAYAFATLASSHPDSE